MAEHLHFSPLENGLDYLLSAVDGLVGDPDARAVKYAVLHLAAGIEVLAKHRLLVEHWTLVVAKPDDAKLDRAAFDRGDFVSVAGETALKRLRALVGLEINEPDLAAFVALQKLRNKVQHFEIHESAAAVLSVAAGALDFALRFIAEHLTPDAAPDASDAIADALPRIRQKLGEIQTYVHHRMTRIAKDIAEAYGLPVTCPRCSQRALVTDGDAPRCLFCGQGWEDGESAALEYADTVLGLSWYETKNGADPPTANCSECAAGAVVWDHFEGRGSQARAFCFACGESFDGTCDRCGAPIVRGEEGLRICHDCMTDLVNRD